MFCLLSFQIVSILLDQPTKIFEESTYSNQTNILSSSVEGLLDKVLSNQTYDDQGINITKKPKFSVYTINIFQANVSGLIIFKNRCETYRVLKSSFSRSDFKNLDEERIDFAFYYPADLLEYLSPQKDFRIVLKIYENDNFFQEKDGEHRLPVEDRVYSLSLPGYKKHFGNHSLPMLFHSKYARIGCRFWNYSIGTWDPRGMSETTKPKSNPFYCETNHLTSFTKIVSLNSRTSQDFWLNLITMFCLLTSGVSIVVMLVVAAFSKQWRKNNLIALNISSAILIQILVFVLSNFEMFSKLCKTFGFVIQYAVLVEFSWMFVNIWAAWRKVSRPFGENTCATRATCISLTWMLPIFPVLTALQLDGKECYENILSEGICFPSLKIKLWTFIVPMVMVLYANVVFFILLIRRFRALLIDQQSLTSNVDSSRNEVIKKIIFYFFAVGIPWIFGILHNFNIDNISSFIFVTIVPLQGTIIFIYTVILDPQLRNSCQNNLKTKFFIGKYLDKGKEFDSCSNDELLREVQNLSSTVVGFIEQIR